MRAKVWANNVLPEPVGPISKILLFDSSTMASSAPILACFLSSASLAATLRRL